MKRYALILAGLTSLFLTGCASTLPRPVEVVRLVPDAHLLADCPVPGPVPRTNGELAQRYQDALAALAGCNDDKAALREWSK